MTPYCQKVSLSPYCGPTLLYTTVGLLCYIQQHDHAFFVHGRYYISSEAEIDSLEGHCLRKPACFGCWVLDRSDEATLYIRLGSPDSPERAA